MPPKTHHSDHDYDFTGSPAGPPADELRRTITLRAHPQAGQVPAPAREDYAALHADIADRGVAVPLDITHAGVVLDGHQRLRAATELDLAQVPVRVVEPEDEVLYIVQAALLRRQLSASQKAALGLELVDYPAKKTAALARSRKNLSANELERATLPAPEGRTRDQVAKLVGASPRTVQDAAMVKDNDAALFAQVKAGQIPAERAARRIRQLQLAASVDPHPPMPEGPFQLILADPPWQMGNPEGSHAPENHYPTQPADWIKQLHVPAADASVLFLWAVNCLLPLALEVINAWGFEYKSNLVWDKLSIGPGTWLRQQHELLLIATRGGHSPPAAARRFSSVLQAKRGRHSEKPKLVYELLEHAYPSLSKLELFAREPRQGWAAYGNQLPKQPS